MKEPKRIMVEERGEIFDPVGPIDSLIASLEGYKENGWESIEVEYQAWGDGCNYYLVRNRLETDSEYNKRMKQLEKQKVRKEKDKEKRREQYEKLRKEFEDK